MKVSKSLQVSDYFLRCMQSLHPTCVGYYREEFHESGPNMLARKPKSKLL